MKRATVGGVGGRTGFEAALTGATLAQGRYQLETCIGQGGLGSVFSALQEPSGRRVAIKFLRPEMARDPIARGRFEREAQVTARLTSYATVRVHDYAQTEAGVPYIVMEHIDGRSLSDAIRTAGDLDPVQAARIGIQICHSLGEAHREGVVHGDLKSANILLVEEDGEEMAKVIDFGLAKLLGEDADDLCEPGMVSGTPTHMSPEQAEGKTLDERADIYSLGVVLYEMITGRTPFVHENPTVLLVKQVTARVPLPSEVRPELGIDPVFEAIVMRALEKDPARRYATARELAEALQAYLGEAPLLRAFQVSLVDLIPIAFGPSCFAITQPQDPFAGPTLIRQAAA